MKKSHLNIEVNHRIQDCVITHYFKPKKNDDGQTVWANVAEGLAQGQGAVYQIIVYIQNEQQPHQFSSVILSASAIKKLYEHIVEIEAKSGEEIVEC